MAWLKIDDQIFLNRKVAQCDAETKLLYIVGLTYCANQLTDGFVPSGVLPLLAGMAGIDWQNAKQNAGKLVDVCLWVATPNGWQIPDYLEYNPSREQVKHNQQVRAEAGQRGGYAKNKQTASNLPDKTLANGKQNSGEILPQSQSPSQSPVLVTDNSYSDRPTEAQSTQAVNGEHAPTNGHSSGSVDISLFLSVIGFNDPEPFMKNVDETLLAKWAYYYQCLNDQQRQAVNSWPALINDRVRNNKPPRLTGEQSARFYQEIASA